MSYVVSRSTRQGKTMYARSTARYIEWVYDPEAATQYTGPKAAEGAQALVDYLAKRPRGKVQARVAVGMKGDCDRCAGNGWVHRMGIECPRCRGRGSLDPVRCQNCHHQHGAHNTGACLAWMAPDEKCHCAEFDPPRQDNR